MWGLSFNEKQNKKQKRRGERERENMAGQRGGRVFANHRRIYATECTAL